MSPPKKLGEMLIDAGLLDESRLRIALTDQKQWDRPLGVTLVVLDLVDEAEMLRVLGRQLNVPTARFALERLPEELRDLLPYEVAKRLRCVPLHIEVEGSREELYVGMADPRDLEALDYIRFRTGMTVHAVLVSGARLDDAIRRQYNQGGIDPTDTADPTQPQLGAERDFELDLGDAKGASEELWLHTDAANRRDSPFRSRLINEPELELSDTDEPAAEGPLAAGSEKRKHTRVPMKAVMGIIRSPSAAGRDISLGGICFWCEGLGVEVGDSLPVELLLQDQVLRVIGTAVRVNNFTSVSQEIALVFSEVSPEAQRLLEEVLSPNAD